MKKSLAIILAVLLVIAAVAAVILGIRLNEANKQVTSLTEQKEALTGEKEAALSENASLKTQLEEEKDIPFHQVMVDNRFGIREAAEKIIRKDHPEIVIVYESHPNGLLRKKIFEECMISEGYSPDRIRSYRVETDALFNGIPSYRLGLKLCSKIKGKFLFST